MKAVGDAKRPSEYRRNVERTVALVTIFTPLGAVLLAVVLCWNRGADTLDVMLCVGMYIATMLGITLGFHRLFTHRSFDCVLSVRALLAVAGSMSAQGPLIFWVAAHRRHHQESDQSGDPHSPHAYGPGAVGILRGWLHAHVWWMINYRPENYFRLVPDLLKDRAACSISRYYLLWIAIGLAIPTLIGGLVTRSWTGAAQGLLWGGFVRIFLAHHMTWSVNSVCHMFGRQPFVTGDESRNNYACAVLTLGEGFHNNHHAFPASARHGLRYWEIDVTFITIMLLSKLKLAWNVKLPDERGLRRKLRPGSPPAW